jgi:pimeloyl-ACP methyl ester carboxylesterase
MTTRARMNTSVAFVGIAALGLTSATLVQYLSKRAVVRRKAIGRKLRVSGHTVQLVDQGTGPCVVVLHGNGSMLEDLSSSGLIDQLAEKYRVIALDRPGFGGTNRGTSGAWTPERESALLLEVLAALGVERALVVAHSWGTLVALSLALRQPTSVNGLVLLSGYYYPTTRLDVALQTPASLPIIGNLLRHTVLPLIGRLSAPAAFRELFRPLPVPQRYVEEYSVGMATRPSQLKSTADDTVSMPGAARALSAHYGEINVPVHLIAGAEDGIVSTVEQSERLNEALPSSSLEILEGVGHMTHHARPDLVVLAVDRLTEQLHERGPRAAQVAAE